MVGGIGIEMVVRGVKVRTVVVLRGLTMSYHLQGI